MKLLNESGLGLAWAVAKVKPPSIHATWVVKGTFDLVPGGVACLAAEPLLPTGDTPYPDGPDDSCFYPSDFALFKPCADIMLVGCGYAPNAKPTTVLPVHVAVGRFRKSLVIVGDRTTGAGAINAGGIQSQPFTRMPIDYTRAFGGAGYKFNPTGRGRVDELNENGKKIRRLPNVEQPDRLVVDLGGNYNPAGFGPIPLTWSQRMSKAGSYGGDWAKKKWPWFPDDFDWRFFNAAPADQQLPGYLTGDEEIACDNLHRTHAHFVCGLPRLRPRLFLRDAVGSGLRVREVALSLDTLWLDMEAEKLVLVWRGLAEIQHKKLKDILDVLLEKEQLDEPPKPLAYYEARFDALPPAIVDLKDDEDEPKTPWPMDALRKELDALAAKMKKDVAELEQDLVARMTVVATTMKAEGADPALLQTAPQSATNAFAAYTASMATLLAAHPELKGKVPALPPLPPEEEMEEAPEPAADEAAWTRESCASHARGGGVFHAEDLRGLDLSGLDLAGVDFTQSYLGDAKLVGTTLARANLAGVDLSSADLSGADLTDAKLDRANLSGAILTKARALRASLVGCEAVGTRFDNADLTGLVGVKALFAEADFSHAILRDADLSGADMSSSLLCHADLTGATLVAASIGRAKGESVCMAGAKLEGIFAGDGADLRKAMFAGARAAGSVWEAAVLDDADFTRAELRGALFESASLARANFFRADLRSARFDEAQARGALFVQANLFRASFEAADITAADLTASNLYGVEFLEVSDDGARYDGAYLKGTKKANR